MINYSTMDRRYSKVNINDLKTLVEFAKIRDMYCHNILNTYKLCQCDLITIPCDDRLDQLMTYSSNRIRKSMYFIMKPIIISAFSAFRSGYAESALSAIVTR